MQDFGDWREHTVEIVSIAVFGEFFSPLSALRRGETENRGAVNFQSKSNGITKGAVAFALRTAF